METIKVSGFDFIKVGKAIHCDKGIQTTYKGKPLHWHLALDLIHEDFADAEQSTYLVYVDNELVYVGEYSSSFEKRWLKRRRDFWHSDNIDNKVKKLVGDGKNGKDVSVWLSLDPYVIGPNNEMININKAIEQMIIEQHEPIWNKRGKSTGRIKPTYRKVTEIVKLLD